MEGITVLAILLTAALVGFYSSYQQADNEKNLEIIEQTEINPLPSTNSSQSFNIQWWRQVYQSELSYNQRYYLSSLSLATGFRHIIVPYVAGKVKAFNLENGKWEWSITIPEQISTGIHLHDAHGYIGGEDGLLLAFEQLSGKKLWQSTLNSSIMSLSSGEKTLYAYSRRGHIYAISPNTGETLWTYIGKEPTSNIYGASQVIESNDIIYVGTGNGNLLALNKDNGKLLWQRTIGQPNGFSDIDNLVDIDSNIIIDQNALYLATFGNRLYAINPINQLNFWQQPVPTIYHIQKDSIASTSLGKKSIDVIVSLTNNSLIQAHNTQTGESIWENKDARLRGLSQLIQYQSYWLSVDRTGVVLLFNRQDGKLNNSYPSRYGIAMNPAIKGENFYWLSKKGELFAMNLKSRNKPDWVAQPVK